MKKQQLQTWLDQSVPVGINWHNEIFYIHAALIVSTLYSVISYAYLFDCNIGMLYRDEARTILLDNPEMIDFFTLWSISIPGFYLLVFVMVVLAVYHYSYHFQISKSIYTMLRLPQKHDLAKRCLAIPVVYFVITVCIALILTGIYYLAYITLTPEVALSHTVDRF